MDRMQPRIHSVPRSRVRTAVGGLALVTLALAGCGSADTSMQGSGSASAPSSAASTSTTPTSPTTSATLPAGPGPVTSPTPSRPGGGPTTLPGPKEPVTVTGTVSVTNDLGRCVTMTIDGRVHVLHGPGVTDLTTGERVTVTGSTRTDMVSYCQLGPIFAVSKVEPAS